MLYLNQGNDDASRIPMDSGSSYLNSFDFDDEVHVARVDVHKTALANLGQAEYDSFIGMSLEILLIDEPQWSWYMLGHF